MFHSYFGQLEEQDSLNDNENFGLCCFFRNGQDASLAAVATGSHIDAIPFSGKYDGVVGVLGALEAINMLKRYRQAMYTCVRY